MAFRMDKLTVKAQEALQRAQELAADRGNPELTPLHVLGSLLAESEGFVRPLLSKIGVEQGQLNGMVTSELDRLPKASGGAPPQMGSALGKLLEEAASAAGKLKDDYVSTEHLLLALATTESKAKSLLELNGIREQDLLSGMQALRGSSRVTDQNPEEKYQALEKYGIDLVERAQQGKLDPVIGRDDEIRRVLQILTRRTKNNPIIIGEPGVGKTAIAEGIAHRIINGDVPENLADRTIYSLDMGALIAGAKYKGEFEERLKSVVKEVQSSEGQIIMFIDEIHTLVGAGAGEGAMDAANILKPALARGELRAIGATTLNEYQKYFEKDKALERRFQKVMIDEPDRDSAISILRGIKEKYENHHKVQIKDDAIISAVELSTRYITDRHLPDKAIDLIDEAASKLRMEINSKPEQLDEIERRIMQLEIEKEAIKRESDAQKQADLNLELANLNEQKDDLYSKWKSERDVIDTIQNAKKEMENLKHEAEQAERNGDFGKVAEIRYGKLKEEERKIEEGKKQLVELQANSKMIKEEVDAEEVAEARSFISASVTESPRPAASRAATASTA